MSLDELLKDPVADLLSDYPYVPEGPNDEFKGGGGSALRRGQRLRRGRRERPLPVRGEVHRPRSRSVPHPPARSGTKGA